MNHTSPRNEKPPRDYKLDIKHYIVPLYTERTKDKGKHKVNQLDTLSKKNLALGGEKNRLDAYLSQLPKLDIKKEMKKSVSFKAMKYQANNTSMSRCTTSSEKYRVNSTAAIHANNLKKNITSSNTKLNPADRFNGLVKSNSQLN